MINKNLIENAPDNYRLRKDILSYEKFIEVYPIIKEVINRFKGKVYNVRFNDALKNAIGEKGYIYSQKKERFIQVNFSDKEGSYITVVHVLLENLTDKRIDADLFITSLDEHRTDYCKRLNRIDEELPNIERYKKQLSDLNELARNIYHSIPTELVDAFRVKYPGYY